MKTAAGPKKPLMTPARRELDAIMTEQKLSSAQLSLKTAYSANVIRQWRTGHKKLPSRTLRYIRFALGIPNPPLKAKKVSKTDHA